MPRPAGPQPRAPTARASRDDSRQGPTPHRAVPSLSLVRRRPRALWTQRYWWQWLAWPRLGGAHALAAFQFMSWLALLPPFCNSGAVAFFGGAAILLPARRSVGAVFGLAWRIPPHSDAACGRHAWASCPGAPDAQVLFGCDAACFLCGWDAQGVVLLRSPSWLGRRPPSIQSPRPTRSLESAEAAQGAGWGATTRTATTMSSSHLAAAVRTQPAPPRHHPPSTKQRVHRPPRPTPTPPTEVTEDGAVAAEREETDARSWRRMRGPQTPLTAWDAPVREWLRGEPSGKRARGTRGRPGDQSEE